MPTNPIGLDSFALHPLHAAPLAQLDYLHEHGFRGLQFGSITDLYGGDAAQLAALKARADDLGLYLHVGVGAINPRAAKQDSAALIKAITRRIELAAQCGWHELHAVMGGPDERFDKDVPWPRQLADSAAVAEALKPVLKTHGSRICLETHADANTFELVQMVETLGPDVLGICFDTANVVLHGEHPIAAARRVAPYTHMLHLKDCLLSSCPTGLRRQTVPLGQGLIDWPALLAILLAAQPDLKLSIEDHKWLFDAELFSPAWRASNHQVSRDEILDLLQLAWRGNDLVAANPALVPETNEQTPYAEQMHARLAISRDYLAGVLKSLANNA